MDSETKNCQNCKNPFTIEPEDFAFYEKMHVPPPTWCPECRMIRRFAWRNGHELFRRKDDRTGKEIFSGIPPQCPAKVYENEYWVSDAFDAQEYAREYDFSRSFFEQFNELLYSVPWAAKSVLRCINSDYSDQASDFKNAYMCFNGDSVEDCAYVTKASYVKDCFDINYGLNNELCYDSVNIDKCYQVFNSVDVENSSNIAYSKDIVGCNNCVGCVGLRRKSYHIFNEPLPKEEYLKKIKELKLGTFTGAESVRKKAQELWLRHPVKFMRGLRNNDSSGERVFDTRKAVHCFNTSNAENIKYCQDVYMEKTTDCYDYAVWGSASQVYESLTCGEQISAIKFCYDCWPSSRNLEYSISCHSSSNLLGCVGLKKKEYCIFNKQYTKEQFAELRSKIVQHMNDMPYANGRGHVYKYGEFFPIEFSPFAYNETCLNDYFPLTQEEAVSKGFLWREQQKINYDITFELNELPDDIVDVEDTVLKENIRCAVCSRAYKIISQELNFLRNNGIPLPRICFRCRASRRQAFVNPPKFYIRHCMKPDCPNEFETSYAPERPEIVYCESCYQQEVS